MKEGGEEEEEESSEEEEEELSPEEQGEHVQLLISLPGFFSYEMNSIHSDIPTLGKLHFPRSHHHAILDNTGAAATTEDK